MSSSVERENTTNVFETQKSLGKENVTSLLTKPFFHILFYYLQTRMSERRPFKRKRKTSKKYFANFIKWHETIELK